MIELKKWKPGEKDKGGGERRGRKDMEIRSLTWP